MNVASKEKKKILQISNYYYPELGGIEKIAQAISNSVRGNYEEKVICFTHELKDRTDYVDTTEIIRCGTKLKVASQQLSFSLIAILKKYLKEYAPDIVIIHMPNPYMASLLLKYINTNTKLIVYWHSDIVKQKVGDRIFRELQFKLLERADRIVATSPIYIADSIYLTKHRNKCVVVPNCIEEDKLQINDEEKKIIERIKAQNHGKVICLSVGRQVPYKGFEYLIQSMKKIDDDYELYLIGREGESTSRIKKLAGGMKNVHFLGEVNNEELKAYLAACDIFCFPSITKNEAFGIALAEAMYFGKPAVTFSIPGSGVNFVSINNVTGIEADNGDIEQYAKAIEILARNSTLRDEMGRNAKDRVNELFLSKYFADNILKVIGQAHHGS